MFKLLHVVRMTGVWYIVILWLLSSHPCKYTIISVVLLTSSLITFTDTFSPNYKLTIGVDFSLKTLEWKDAKINLQLW